MIIVSQDGETMINFDNFIGIKMVKMDESSNTVYKILGTTVNDNVICLAKYSTLEKATDVFTKLLQSFKVGILETPKMTQEQSKIVSKYLGDDFKIISDNFNFIPYADSTNIFYMPT